MRNALWLLAVQGVLGAFDTLYYHEWRARLASGRIPAAPELKLHAWRSFVYAILFVTLPIVAWLGVWAAVLAGLLAIEIGLTLADFVVEDRVRAPLGGLYPGERISHALMGIVYGAMLSRLVPVMCIWWGLPTAFRATPAPIPRPLFWLLEVMGAGVLLSGIRDAVAASYACHGWQP